jgi:CrcB protein
MMLKNLLLVGVGGMLGSILRYLASVVFKQQAFPITTLSINVIGSFIIGMVMALAIKQANFADWKLFLATGICGGFTTFSTFSWECLQLLQQQKTAQAFTYIAISLVAGIVAAWFGYWLVKN